MTTGTTARGRGTVRDDGRKRGGGGRGPHQRWREAGAARLGVGRRWRGGDGAVRREGEQATANGVERRGHRLPSGQMRGSSWRWSGRHGQGRRGSPGSSRERGRSGGSRGNRVDFPRVRRTGQTSTLKLKKDSSNTRSRGLAFLLVIGLVVLLSEVNKDRTIGQRIPSLVMAVAKG